MPGSGYREISGRLTAAGFSPETPCAIISRATSRDQRTHLTAVSDLHRAPRLASPTLLVVGDVVRFADRCLVEEVTPFRGLELELELGHEESLA
jgi:siroheme synthase